MPKTIGKFEILSTLGQGAASTIFKIRRHEDQKVYALKVVQVEDSQEDLKFVHQLENEYQIGTRLEHPYLVNVHALELEKKLFGRIAGGRLLMEWIDGIPLSHCGKGMPLAKLLQVFHRTAKVLAYLHEQNVFHADIKPDNIMVTRTGKVKVIDLGLAWRRGESKERVQGTLEFLSPEQANKKIVNEKSDIFNLGASMYYMLAGMHVPAPLRDPRPDDTFGRSPDTLVIPIHERNPQVPPILDELVRECIRYRPSKRPADMITVWQRLKAITLKLQQQLNQTAPV